MDAFYASVEQHDRPELRGKAVLVGGSPKARGVVAAASYEARKFGCRSAMPMKTAVRKCPQAEIVPPRFPRYREVSREIMAIFRAITPLVEPLSLDEAFLDITHVVETGATAAEVAAQLRARVKAKTGLTVSCGVAQTKSVAKIASDVDKPDGLTVVAPGEERSFLAPLPVRDLWGVGPKTAERLHKAGVSTIGELAERPLPWLIMRFGIRGEWFHRLANGIDDRPVEVSRETKSVSAEVTFAEDVSDLDALREAVIEQARRVGGQLRKASIRARTVQIKLRLADFTTFTRQRTLPIATDAASMIEAAALELLENEVGGGRQFRLVGTGVSNLSQSETAAQLSLFDRPGGSGPAGVAPDLAGAGQEEGKTSPERAALDQAVRDLQTRFGDDAVDWGSESDGEWSAGWDREWTDGWQSNAAPKERDEEPV
jgi:DNA polymerase-4